MKTTTPIIILFIVLLSESVFAQGGRAYKKKDKDTNEVTIKIPYVDVLYGESHIQRNGMSGEISNVTIYGISLGLKKEKEHKESDDIIVQDKNGLTFSLGRAPQTAQSDSTYWNIPVVSSNTLEFWSLGSVNGTGYGYKFGNNVLMLNVEDNATWNSFSPRSFDIMQNPTDWQYMRDMDGTMRLGSSMTSSIECRLGNTLTLNGGYTWNQVLPRHMFWYWLGSEVIEGLAGAAIDNVISNFGNISPKSLPVMHFILKSALLYGVKELRRTHMNWPFETATPMNITYWNIGVGLTL